MGEIIALIIGITVWVVSSVLENNKEAAKQTQPTKKPLSPQKEPSKVVGGIGDLLKNISNQAEGANSEAVKEPGLKSVLERNIKTEKKDSRNRRYSILGKSDVKRAFVYSEIFNRKY